MSNQQESVVVLGASANPDRYSNKAVKSLANAGHQVIPIHPALQQIDGIPVTSSLEQVDQTIDTVTIYVNPQRLLQLIPEIARLNPKRVILNPGTESTEVIQAFQSHQIQPIQACTLVMLATQQF